MQIEQPRKGDIFFADLTDAGNGAMRGFRPIIIIQNNVGNIYSSSVIAAIITSAEKKELPTHVHLSCRHGLIKPSVATLEDIVTIPKDKLIRHLGTVVNTDAEEELNKAIKVSLDV